MFEEKKNTMITERRSLLKNNQIDQYKKLCASIQAEEENNRTDVLDDIFIAINIAEESFQKALMKFMQEPEKYTEIQKLKELSEETAYNMNSPKYEQLPLGLHIEKKEALAVHARLHELSISHLAEVKKMPLENL